MDKPLKYYTKAELDTAHSAAMAEMLVVANRPHDESEWNAALQKFRRVCDEDIQREVFHRYPSYEIKMEYWT